MSSRGELAKEAFRWIEEWNLVGPIGGDYGKLTENKKTYYALGFSKPRILDGFIKIYAPKFVQVKFQTRYNALPHRASYVYNSLDEALQFIYLAFVKYEYETALAVPTRPTTPIRK